MAVSDGETITVVKDMGLVSHVFDDRTLAPLDGHLAIGHTRYSTTGSSTWRNAQPVYRDVGDAGFALGHNGNLVNTAAARRARPACCPGTVTTRHRPGGRAVAELETRRRSRATTAASSARCWQVLPRLEGAFSLVLMDDERTSSACATRTASGRCASASSTTAAGCWRRRRRRSTSSARTSCASSSPARWSSSTPTACARCRPFPPSAIDPKLCLFEFVYFARPDTPPLRPQRAPGAGAHGRAARRAGARSRPTWSWACPSRACPPPRATPGRVGIPYGQGLVKNRYIGRTFIAPEPGDAGARRAHEAQPAAREHRRQAARRGRRLDRARHHAAPARVDAARGRRGRGAPAHLLAAVPWPCFYGIDTGARSELLAAEPRGRARSATTSASTRSRTSTSTGWSTATGARRRRVLQRLPHRRVPGRRSRSTLRKGVLEVDSRRPDARRCSRALDSVVGGLPSD